MKRYLVVLALTFAAWPAAAAGDSPWTLRFHGALVRTSGQRYTADAYAATSHFEIGGGGGAGLAVEYRLSDRIGIEMSILLAGLDAEWTASASPPEFRSLGLSMVPVSIGVPFHFGIGDRTDLRVGLTLSHVSYVDSSHTLRRAKVRSSVEIGSDLALGAALGLERRIGSGGWAFGAGLHYLRTDADATSVDPWITTLGFAYRF